MAGRLPSVSQPSQYTHDSRSERELKAKNESFDHRPCEKSMPRAIEPRTVRVNMTKNTLHLPHTTGCRCCRAHS
jgi:hypothetical protein